MLGVPQSTIRKWAASGAAPMHWSVANGNRLMSLLPISSLPDLRWLAEETNMPELREFLAKLID